VLFQAGHHGPGLIPQIYLQNIEAVSLGVGQHRVTPEVIILPEDIVQESVLPATLEVDIALTTTSTGTGP
jgi:hypothetical protein